MNTTKDHGVCGKSKTRDGIILKSNSRISIRGRRTETEGDFDTVTDWEPLWWKFHRHRWRLIWGGFFFVFTREKNYTNGTQNIIERGVPDRLQTLQSRNTTRSARVREAFYGEEIGRRGFRWNLSHFFFFFFSKVPKQQQQQQPVYLYKSER